jgi:hypothetical protein
MLEQLKRVAGSSILDTHPHYRTAIGVFGVSLPPILVLASWLGFLETRELQNSISAYYWAGMRDWFVGTVLFLETFLITIFGVSWFEKGRELAAPEPEPSAR